MNHWLVYLGERRGGFSLNSRAEPGAKFIIQKDVPFAIDDKDLWIASMRDFVILSEVEFAPTMRRMPTRNLTYCTPFEGAFIEGLASSCPDPARIVEIGTGRGNSLLRMLYGLNLHGDARVWSIDLVEDEDTREYISAAFIPSWRYDYIVGNSAEVADKVDEPLDLVFVDGSHSDAGVRADIEAWAGKVKPGGVMAFHDYQNPLHEVTAAIDDLMVGEWERVGLVGTIVAFEKVAEDVSK